MRPLLLAALLLAACNSAATNDCICSVVGSISEETIMCGQSTCLDGLAYGCDAVVGVTQLGSCGLPDGGDNDAGLDMPTCLLPYAACDPTNAICCTVTNDGGTVDPTCDPTTRRCCVPTNGYCTATEDCCEGHECVDTLGSGLSDDFDGGVPARHCGS